MKTKKIFGLIITVIAVICLAMTTFIFRGADVSEVSRTILPEEPQSFTVGQVNNAMDAVTSYFKREFEGCKLTALCYDEAFSDEAAAAWQEKAGGEIMVLQSSFLVGAGGGDGSLTPNGSYTGWQWVLALRGSGWEILSNGY